MGPYFVTNYHIHASIIAQFLFPFMENLRRKTKGNSTITQRRSKVIFNKHEKSSNVFSSKRNNNLKQERGEISEESDRGQTDFQNHTKALNRSNSLLCQNKALDTNPSKDDTCTSNIIPKKTSMNRNDATLELMVSKACDDRSKEMVKIKLQIVDTLTKEDSEIRINKILLFTSFLLSLVVWSLIFSIIVLLPKEPRIVQPRIRMTKEKGK